MIECNNFIRLGKNEYKINTHFSVWIKFLIKSEKLSGEESDLKAFLLFLYEDIFIDKPKVLKMLISALLDNETLLSNQRLIETSVKSIMKPILDFAEHRQTDDKKDDNSEYRNPTEIFDFEKDWQYIDLAFLSYGIDLYNCNLHWWRFKWLLQAIMVDDFKDIVSYRALPYSSISKLSKSEQSYYKKKKEAYALKHENKLTADEYQEKMKNYILKRQKEISK